MIAIKERARAAVAGARRALRSPVVEAVLIAGVLTVGTVYIAPVVAGEVAYAVTAGIDRAHRDVSAGGSPLVAPARAALLSPLTTHVVNGAAWTPGGAK